MEKVPITVVGSGSSLPVANEIVAMLGQEDWCRADSADAGAAVGDSSRRDCVFLMVHRDSRFLQDLISFYRTTLPRSPFVFVNFFHYPSPCLELLKFGFDDFIRYPLEIGDLRSCISSLWARREYLRPRESERFKRDLTLELALRDLIGVSPVFDRVIQEIRVLANSDATVLITGETGTGKDMCARAIHYSSARADNPFVPVNCGAIPEELFENEFFGHERGAFTDARERYGGIVQQAEGGTIFLDDIDVLALKHQVKLLRLIEEQVYTRLGSGKLQKPNVRTLAATNVDLIRKVESGLFREDLYYRLSVLELVLPPLRERAEDIPLLAKYFADRYSQTYHKPGIAITDSALTKLAKLRWKGNVRELESVVHSAVIHADHSPLDNHDFFCHDNMQGHTLRPALDLKPFKQMKQQYVADFERDYIEQLLAQCGGNISEAARRAGKNRRAFWEIMRKHGLQQDRK